MGRPTYSELMRLVIELRGALEAERARHAAEVAELRAYIQTIEARHAAEVAELNAQNVLLRAEVTRLQAEVGSSSGRPPRGRTPAPGPKKVRAKRKVPFVRRLSEPTERRVHRLEHCPDCGERLAGGSLKRTRETIDLPPSAAVVTEHQMIERRCPRCRKRCTPRLADQGITVGKQRFGPNLTAQVAWLRDEARMPIDVIRRHLATINGLQISVGGIIRLLAVAAARGQAQVERLRAMVRVSDFVNADETSWRENGQFISLWVHGTRDIVLYVFGRRDRAQINAILGADYAGIVVSDGYAAYNHFGVHQRCWAHVLRKARDLLTQHPGDATLADWVVRLTHLFLDATVAANARPPDIHDIRRGLDQRLIALCEEAVGVDLPHRRLATHMHKLQAEWFTFVVTPGLPSTNNRAERDLRPIVIARKIFGGTRSPTGSENLAIRWSLLATWKLRGLNPFEQTRNLLLSPQP